MLAIAGTGYGLIGLLIIILLVVLIFYFMREGPNTGQTNEARRFKRRFSERTRRAGVRRPPSLAAIRFARARGPRRVGDVRCHGCPNAVRPRRLSPH